MFPRLNSPKDFFLENLERKIVYIFPLSRSSPVLLSSKANSYEGKPLRGVSHLV